MSVLVELELSPKEASDQRTYLAKAAHKLGVKDTRIAHCRIVRRSIDARKRGNIKVNMALDLCIDDQEFENEYVLPEYSDVSSATEVVIVGSGPAGLFLALELIELGLRPIVLERGLDVSQRKRDIAALNRGEDVNPDSNYSFGEGGAGTYSDGKLYTRSKKRGSNAKALHIFRMHGADESILYDAHPHIGTDKLPRIIEAIRHRIVECGGIVKFGARVVDVIIKDDRAQGVALSNGDIVSGAAVVLATGHSARDIYQILHNRQVLLEAKPFAMGFRVEHPQEMIDMIQYKQSRGEYLPAAAYSLVAQSAGRGVYSFCMCPGGFIVPAMTSQGECVVNGMSPSGRNNIYANSGIVTEVRLEDFADLVPHFGVLAGMKFQEQLEKMGFAQGGGAQKAPAQRLTDFVEGHASSSMLGTSYHPGLTSSRMDQWMPKFMVKSLRGGLRLFDNKMKGYLTDQAQVIGIESRTSSPVRIPRNRDNGMHPQIQGLFPLGEGAGYAGGIISAAVDGLVAGENIKLYINNLWK